MRILGALLAAVLLTAVPAVPARAAAPPVTGNPDPVAHDPTLIKQGRWWYEIITGDSGTRTYLPIRRSIDLVHWTYTGTVFDTPPAWVAEELGVTPADFWAPDITWFDGEYHLYYAASSFGTNDSVIGLATTKSLDRPQWVDRGLVLRTTKGVDDVNAIDPDVSFDRAGNAYLAYGSFWDGLRMRRLDTSTGLLSTTDTTEHRIASRGGMAIEGPSITYHDGWYYLFVSFDFCCRGVNSDYRVMVGRSRSITGPYLDAAGKALTEGGGTQILAGYNDFAGPGHGDVYGDLFAHHYYDRADGGAPKGSIRRISWAHGWPRLSDPLSGNRGYGHGDAYVQLVHRDSRAVLANASCGYEGADVTLAAADRTNACQQWQLIDRGDGLVSLTNRQSNKVAEVAACVDADGARVAQWGWLANDCQRFRLTPSTGGWSRIVSPLAGRALQPAGCGAAGAAVQTFPAGACQDFRIQPVGDVLLTDVANTTRIGDRWRFTHVSDGWYRITGTLTHRTLGGTLWRIEALTTGGYRLTGENGRTREVLLLTP
ncbi:Ricin-type beta-trefoil lectin domain-like [Actinoplanes philippinensis]|uniref:Ricin-type beta-trefoil lectin domain-like n=1 Tax=Actinoplanes philippinensis TaxID=35752 RepID=A0A1I2NKB0_9ACTN|nr:family 43 glycosylhydrolase [Actinoplanes philippinensis]SFG01731.1 Ricin-type beta-trefoil lectin domain-like [Actinoplanes philippinensis]